MRVREGMERVEKQNDMGLESAYDVGVEDMENSEEEVRIATGHRSTGKRR